jgi:hypothetical protein
MAYDLVEQEIPQDAAAHPGRDAAESAAPGADDGLGQYPEYVQKALRPFGRLWDTSDGWLARCPVPSHDDQHPSLRLTIGEEGRILVHCRGGCNSYDVLDAVGLAYRDLYAPYGKTPMQPIARAAGDDLSEDDSVGRDRVYTALLGALKLSDAHREQLRGRGLSDDAIEAGGYRSLGPEDHAPAAATLYERFGDDLAGIPGLYLRDGAVAFATNAVGLLVPVRDYAGRVVALKLRKDKATGEGRYAYLSGGKVSSGAPLHVPALARRLLEAGPEVVRVTEGELKADVATALSGVPTLGVPGVSLWRRALPAIFQCQARNVLVSFDWPDVCSKLQVWQRVEDLVSGIRSYALAPSLETWPKEHKGIDDALAAGAAVERHDMWETPKKLGEAFEQLPSEPRAPAAAGDFISAYELIGREYPDPRFAVPGLIPEGLTLFVSKPKMGKSWFFLHVAEALASGGTALGSIPLDAGSVLYLALEDTERRLRDRLLLQLSTDGRPAPRRLTLRTTWPRFDQGGLTRLEAWLEEHTDTNLVIIDTWAKVKPERKSGGDAYAADYREAAAVKALADRHRVAVVALHHERKLPAVDPLDAVSGTTGLTGAADSILILQRKRGEDKAQLFVTGRDVEERYLRLAFDGQHGLWTLADGPEEKPTRPWEQAIIDHLANAEAQGRGPQTPADVATALRLNQNTARSQLHRMSQARRLVSRGGSYSLPA